MLEPSAEWSGDLSPAELSLLLRIEESLHLVADVSRADVSLVVKDGDEAVIVAQAQPHSIASLYRQPWTGRRLPLAEHPDLVAGLQRGSASRRQHNLLAQGTPIIEQVLPVIAGSQPAPAALRIQTNLIAWERQKRRHASFRKAVKWLTEMALRGDVRGAADLSRFGEWDGILFVDEAYNIRYVSGIANNLYRRLGYLDDLHDRHVGDLQTKDEFLLHQAFETLACQEHQVEEGNRRWTRKVAPIWSYSPHWWPFTPNRRQKPSLCGALVMVHDDTDDLRKAQEMEVLTTMIKEVHHRVKNNLQTVASILRMQARRTENRETQVQLREAVNRVLAASVIHEFLSHGGDQSINIRDVCQRIATQTQRAAVQPGKQILLKAQGPAIYLPSQQATACALVSNELLLNALEHGFKDRDSGVILLNLLDRGDQVVIEVSDDGSGLPEGFDLQQEESLGLSIVRTLVEGDLRGEFVLEPGDPGARARVTFAKEAWRQD